MAKKQVTRKGGTSKPTSKANSGADKAPDVRSLVVKGDDNFFGLEPELTTFDRARFVVMSAPYEGTVSYGKGTGAGPAAIKRASQQVELFDEITRAEHIPRHGVCTLKPFSPKCSAEKMTMGHVYGAAKQIVAAGKFPILVGGEHSVSPGAIKACAEAWPELSVLHIDAHSDLREAYHDDAYSHASAAARFNEWCPIVQIGIRSRERMETGKPGKPVWCYHAFDYRNSGPWIDEAISHLTRNVYLTIDVDGFDPSVFPGTGTPEPGGLSWYTGLDIIERLCKSRNVIGFDVVEVAPTKGTQVSEFAAARLMGRTMAFISHYCWRAESV